MPATPNEPVTCGRHLLDQHGLLSNLAQRRLPHGLTGSRRIDVCQPVAGGQIRLGGRGLDTGLHYRETCLRPFVQPGGDTLRCSPMHRCACQHHRGHAGATRSLSRRQPGLVHTGGAGTLQPSERILHTGRTPCCLEALVPFP